MCSQAFRLGERAWALQFHPEIRLEQIEEWVRLGERPNGDAIVAELRERIDDWQAFGARLLRAFLRAAERDLVPGHVSTGSSA